jgi:hypothetical protein
MSSIRRRLTESEVNPLILAATVNGLLEEAAVNSKITVSRIGELLSSATIKNQIISLFNFSEIYSRTMQGNGNDKLFDAIYLEKKGHYRFTDVNGLEFECIKDYSGKVPFDQSLDLGSHYVWSNGSQNGIRPSGGNSVDDLIIVKIERKEALS